MLIQNTTVIFTYVHWCLLGHIVQDCHVDKLVLLLCVRGKGGRGEKLKTDKQQISTKLTHSEAYTIKSRRARKITTSVDQFQVLQVQSKFRHHAIVTTLLDQRELHFSSHMLGSHLMPILHHDHWLLPSVLVCFFLVVSGGGGGILLLVKNVEVLQRA